MEPIKRFFECLVPVSACNLKCDYCYVIQNNGNKGRITDFKYSVEQMRKALTRQRLGGVCYFSFCGAGETLFHPELPALVSVLLKEGHYVNITTNGTYTKGFEKLLELVSPQDMNRLLLSVSLHWLELERKGWKDVYAQNVKNIKQAGASILIQFNLYDGYIPYLEQIKAFCKDNFGALPQVAATRMEEKRGIRLHTQCSKTEYIQYGQQFDSPLFAFTIKNFNRPLHKFCYAGEWSYVMNLERGIIRPCYCNGEEQDIFADSNKEIQSEIVGVWCHNAYCINSSHFLSLGVIPSLYKDVTYADLRDREDAGWFSSEMKAFLSQKLSQTNVSKSVFGMMISSTQELIRILGRIYQRRKAKWMSKQK